MSSKLVRTIKLGVKSLLLHKLRSALAILGILIGVTAVIWLVAMGEGVSYQAQQQIKELGATNIIVRSIKPPAGTSRTNARILEYGLKRDDFQRMQTIPSVQQAIALREIRKEVRFGDKVTDIQLVGCTPEYQGMNNLQMFRGEFLKSAHLANVENVAVLAHQTARELFPYEDPIGRSIQIDSDFYVVIGETSERQASGNIGGSFSGKDYNLDVYIPLTTLRQRIGDQVITARSGSFEAESVELSQVTLTVGSVDQVASTAGVVNALLEKFHDTPDYSVIVPQELLQQARVTQIMFNLLLVLIAGIALLVGGIGIMNIMLATVTERTREIGVRRALGAKQRDIIYQFLTETVVLSATGGLLGVFLGFLCEPAVRWGRSLVEVFMPDLMSSLPSNIQQLEPRVAWWSIIVAFSISLAAGVVFGLYPARRAALMDPIEALRHE